MRRDDLILQYKTELRSAAVDLVIREDSRPGSLPSELVVEVPAGAWHSALAKMKGLGEGMRLVFLAATPAPFSRAAYLENATGEVQIVALMRGAASEEVSVGDLWPWARYMEREAVEHG